MERQAQLTVHLDDGVVNIPYRAETYDGGEIHAYQRIVGNPSAIQAIPEIQDFPFLQDFLGRVNKPGGTMETARIARWYTDGGSPLHIVAIGMLFQDRARFANYQNAMIFAGDLLEAMLHSDAFTADQYPPRFEIQRCNLNNEGVSGWIIDLFLPGSVGYNDKTDPDLQQKLRVVASVLGC